MDTITSNLKRATIDMILLSLLLEGDKYGYQLAQKKKKRSNNQIVLLEGSMYPILNRLKDNNDVEFQRVKSGEKLTRIYYHITEHGREHLTAMINTYTSDIVAINILLNI